jgi:hypothetical protein
MENHSRVLAAYPRQAIRGSYFKSVPVAAALEGRIEGSLRAQHPKCEAPAKPFWRFLRHLFAPRPYHHGQVPTLLNQAGITHDYAAALVSRFREGYLG